MIEILPLKAVHSEDLPMFGSESVLLSKLAHKGLPVAVGIVVTPPAVKLKTTIEHWDFSNKDIIEQRLVILKKDIKRWPIPEILTEDTKGHDQFLVGEIAIKSVKTLWLTLLQNWLESIRQKIYLEGFNQPVTDALQSQIVLFADSKVKIVYSYLDDQKQVMIEGELESGQVEEVKQLTIKTNYSLIIPHKYRWIVGNDVKLAGIEPYNQLSTHQILKPAFKTVNPQAELLGDDRVKTTVKLFYDLSKAGLVIDYSVDGVFLDSGKIFKPENTKESFEELLFKLIESASTFKFSPVLLKLADQSETWGDVRGALRLIHQKSLFTPLVDAVLYARNKRIHHNIHLVIPYVRGVYELEQLKRELAAKKLIRKNSLNIWLEADLPENLINLEDYLESGIDGVIINIDELASHLLGFDYKNEEVAAYKSEVLGLVKFMEDGLRLMHKVQKPFLVMGKFALEPEVLHFLIDKGVYGLILPKYEIHSARELIHQTEKKVIFGRVT